MSEFHERLNQLEARLAKMVEYQEYFYREINLLQAEISRLKNVSPQTSPRENVVQNDAAPRPTEPPPSRAAMPPPALRSNLEELVGRNLISIVGIIVTIIGVAIGGKYAIDNDLISPAARILAGYAFGAGLLVLSLRLRAKYENFSAVLLSGAAAIFYFITYFAHAFYGLIPQTAAFVVMLLVTLFTVGAAIHYNRQIIAHVGLVGAYAVPFLVGGNAGQTAILFGYTALVNFGVLAVLVKKYWKPLFYTSFVFTQLIFAAWFVTQFNPAVHFALAAVFACVFFATFYAAFLVYKLIAKEPFGAENVLLLLANSFVFYGVGCALIYSQPNLKGTAGLFTLLNAAIHFGVGAAVKRYAFADRGNIQFLAALGLIFVTLAVPVELRGDAITLCWTAEAAVLFWLGRARRMPLYEYFSYAAMLLAAAAVHFVWLTDYRAARVDDIASPAPDFRPALITSAAFVAAFAVIGFLRRRYRAESAREQLFDFVFYGSIWWIASVLLLMWARVSGVADAERLGLSVWWGIYALVLVVIGIAGRKKYLRIAAIALFAVTLAKLFFYDIAALGTIAKTIVFVALGVLLLTISFLYNKYKVLIFDESSEKR